MRKKIKKIKTKTKRTNKSKDKGIMWILSLPVFDVQLAVRIGMSADRANEVTLDKFKTKPAEGFAKFYDGDGVQGQFIKLAGGGYAIWVKKKNDPASLIHEITHFVQYLFRDRRTPLTEDTEEIYAYMTAHIIDRLLKLKVRDN